MKKVFSIIIKILILILTTIWGVLFGIFAPLSIMFGDIVREEIATSPIIVVWLINSAVCYVGGTVLVMLNCTKIAAIVHTIGLIVTLYIHTAFSQLLTSLNGGVLPVMYMPIIFVSILSIILMVITNWNSWMKKAEERNAAKYDEAPSILGGTYKTDEKPKNPKKSKK